MVEDTQAKLYELRDHFVQELEKLEALEDEAAMADSHYADKLAEFEEAHAPLVARRATATEALDVHKKRLDELKKTIRETIEEHYYQTGDKFPLGDDETFALQERLDWEYNDDEMVKATMIQGLIALMQEYGLTVVRGFDKAQLTQLVHTHTKNELPEVMLDELKVQLTDDMMDTALLFMRMLLKVEVAKGDFRKFIGKHIDKEKDVDGDMVVVIPEELEWMPMQFTLKPTTVVSDKKALVWAERSRDE